MAEARTHQSTKARERAGRVGSQLVCAKWMGSEWHSYRAGKFLVRLVSSSFIGLTCGAAVAVMRWRKAFFRGESLASTCGSDRFGRTDKYCVVLAGDTGKSACAT